MPTDPTSNPLSQGIPMPPILTGDEIYDSLMQAIEPELMIAAMPTLEEKYKNETPEQAKERAARYQKAFDTYDQKFEEYKRNWQEQWGKYKRQAMRGAEEKNRVEETNDLSAVEAAITQA